MTRCLIFLFWRFSALRAPSNLFFFLGSCHLNDTLWVPLFSPNGCTEQGIQRHWTGEKGGVIPKDWMAPRMMELGTKEK